MERREAFGLPPHHSSHSSPFHWRAHFRCYCHRLTCSFSLDSTFHRRKGGGSRLKFQPNTLLTADSAVKKRTRVPSPAGLQREIKTARAIGLRSVPFFSIDLLFSLSLSHFRLVVNTRWSVNRRASKKERPQDRGLT